MKISLKEISKFDYAMDSFTYDSKTGMMHIVINNNIILKKDIPELHAIIEKGNNLKVNYC